MKAKFTIDEVGRVILSYDGEDWDGNPLRITREFSCPIDGGYVREYRDGDWKQVCDGLCSRGSTLICSSRANLLGLIRREYRAMRRAEKRETT